MDLLSDYEDSSGEGYDSEWGYPGLEEEDSSGENNNIVGNGNTVLSLYPSLMSNPSPRALFQAAMNVHPFSVNPLRVDQESGCE